MKKKLKWVSIPVGLAVIVAIILTMLPVGVPIVEIKPSRGIVSVEARTILAAKLGGTTGFGNPVSQQIAAIFSRGGPPIVSVTYNFDAILDTDGVLSIDNVGLPDVHCTKAKVKEKVKAKVKGGVTEYDAKALKDDIQANYEIWTLLSAFSVDDPVRNGILLDNERIEQKAGKDYLVITLAYFDIHIYSLEPLRFVTRISGLDAGPIEGEWWL